MFTLPERGAYSALDPQLNIGDRFRDRLRSMVVIFSTNHFLTVNSNPGNLRRKIVLIENIKTKHVIMLVVYNIMKPSKL